MPGEPPARGAVALVPEVRGPAVEVDVVVPYSRGDLVSRAHSTGEVLAEEHLMDGTRVHARVDEALAAELRGAA